jgi:acyl-CoA hydrolase
MISLILCLMLQQPLLGPPPLQLEHSTSFVVFGGDTNSNPPMAFGGKLFSEMDRTAGVATKRLLYSSAVKDYVTKSGSIEYKQPAYVKDLLFVTAKVIKLGEKSITMRVTITRETGPGKQEVIAVGEFVYVSFDLAAKKSAPHGLKLP